MNRIGTLFLRGEGGLELGMGHISRLVSIANHLSSLPFDSVSFALVYSKPNVHSFIRNQGFQSVSFSSESEFIKQVTSNDVVVVDGYNFDSNWLKAIHDKSAKLIYIDDTQHVDLASVDIVINHTPGYSRRDFNVSDSALLFLGPKYCMIRPEFLQDVQSKNIESISQIAVSLGTSNTGNLLDNLLRLLKAEFPNAHFHVIPGDNVVSEEVIDSTDQVYSFLTSEEMINLFDNCDLGVFPMSTIYMEALARKMMVAGGYFVDNQKVVYQKLINLNIVIGLGDFRSLNSNRMKLAKSEIMEKMPFSVDMEYGEGWDEIRSTIKEWL